MKKTYLLLLCISTLQAVAQSDSLQAITEIVTFQQTLNEQYKSPDESPLDQEEFYDFKGHEFFPINLNYRVTAKLDITEGTPFFDMKTTTSRMSTERVYGYVIFTLEGNEFRLPVYQSKDLMKNEEYADYLFFPFTDETNDNETYGGGRYIDLRIPEEGDSLLIDFNMAYNPYCAYSPRYSCPLVPAENQMNIRVPVGVKYPKKVESQSPDVTQTDSQIFTKVEVHPEYPGGFEALAKFIHKNMTYPRAAVKKKIHGTVYVQFIVERDGSISSVNTIRGISKECDMEAERVVRLMPKWKPGQEDGKNVAVRYVLPIKFRGRPGWTR